MSVLRVRGVVIVAAALGVLMAAGPALAYKQFQDRWEELYLDDHPDEDFAKLCRKKAKCNVCHQGRKKHNNNPYGEVFVGKLGKKDRRDKEKIVQAILEAGKLRSDPGDDQSPTYDQLIAESKLPGGPLEKVKQEPEKDEE